ncbi:lipase class 3 family protein [Exidia glandulosa HHB12029]|uniref:Lipase class 3 family protein n=1 Tax=Exidia glandulosa HHB12029 TaxID=1314781 RepID=A0A165PHM4_EXIGL|nr:lipase class 3 family protein [Exidia glandulosa HHB12029]
MRTYLYLLSLPAAALCAVLPRQTPSALAAADISSFKPFTFFASAAYCPPSTTKTWTCGGDCDALADFIPRATGGDGTVVQFWFVGYHPPLDSIVVAHQGTNPDKILPVVVDADAFLEDLDPEMFPGLPDGVKAHQGFQDAHALTASDVKTAVLDTMSQFNTSNIVLSSHSLGAAISMLDALYLKLNLPEGTNFKFVGYGTPRVGNQAFADFVDSQLPDLTRINNKQDPVPIVPGRFLGFRHPSGEVHISSSGQFLSCDTQDDTATGCIDDTEGNIFDSSLGDHSGPYDGVVIGNCDDDT